MRLCRLGENSEVEFKSAKGGFPKEFWKSFSAFANTNGGKIVLGVTQKQDAFYPDGLSQQELVRLRKQFWDDAHNRSKVNNPLLSEHDVQDIDLGNGQWVLVFYIPRAKYQIRPIYLTENPFGHTYKRRHEGDYVCTDAEVRAMMRDADETGNDGKHLDYGMEEVDIRTLREYRQMFQNSHIDHILNKVDDKEFLRKLGAYYIDSKTEQEGLTLAGLLLFGTGLAVREALPMIRMDYIDLTGLKGDMRYSDRLTYDFSWENNLFQFMARVMPKLVQGIKVPFVLKQFTREDDAPIYKLVREAVTNMIIHADFLSEGVLRIEKREDGFFFSNPGTLKLPVEDIYRGGISKARNPKMQDMLRMIGYGDNLGTGFPTMVEMWKAAYGVIPILRERPELDTVELLFPGMTTPQVDPSSTPQDTPQVESLLRSIGAEALSKADIMERLRLTDRKNFVATYLQPALALGLVEMTIPGKPQSRLQKYRLTEQGVEASKADNVGMSAQELTLQVDPLSTPQDTPQDTPQVPPKSTPQVTPKVESLFRCIGEDVLPKADIMERLQLTDRKNFVATYLQPALAQGFVEMTIPDKPQSRLQKYRLTEQGMEASKTDNVGRSALELTPQVESLLRCVGEEALSKADIMERLRLTDRKNFVAAYLQPALALGLVEMTIPDKPQSRLQKYRLTEQGLLILKSL